MEMIKTKNDRLLEGTGSWILGDRVFTQWLNEDQSSTLWLHGDPGKGKTMLAISLIEELSKVVKLEGPPLSSTALAYFFCDYRDDRRNSTVNVLRGLLYQVFCQRSELLNHFRDQYEMQKDQLFSSPRALENLWRMLQNTLNRSTLRQVYLVVDALDECDDKSLEGFLTLLSPYGFGQKRDSKRNQCNIKWLLTSRNHVVIDMGLTGSLAISLELHSLHVANTVRKFIDVKVEELGKRKRWSVELQHFVEETLHEKAEGTFLWVALACHELRKSAVRAIDTRSILQELPSDLRLLYERMMQQVVNNEDERLCESAKEILRSVTVAFRPLTMEELAITAGLPIEYHNDPVALSDFIEQCGSLLRIHQGRVVFVHQSVRDYLLSTRTIPLFSSSMRTENMSLALRCFDYICGATFKDYLDRGGVWTKQREAIEHSSLYVEYPVLFWMDHGRFASPDIANKFDLNTEFFQRNSRSRQAWFDAYWRIRHQYEAKPSSFTPLHLAAYAGLLWLVQILLYGGHKIDLNTSDSLGNRPLYWAALNGHETVVELLLGEKVEVEAINNNGETALFRAASNGHEAVVRLLLEKGAAISRNNNGEIALFQAASNGHKAVVRLLLETGADVAANDKNGWTALHSAAMGGHEAVVRLLLERGADVTAEDNGGWTALHSAARDGHEAVVWLLLERGADVAAEDNGGWTALHSAAMGGHEAVVRLLLERGADVAAEDKDGWTALHSAARGGHEAVVRLLLERGADVAAEDKGGWTALHSAARGGHEAVVRLLLEKGQAFS